MILPLYKLRTFTLDVLGAAGAYSWVFDLLLLLLVLAGLSFLGGPFIVPIAAFLVGVWAFVEYYREQNGLPPLLPNARKFLLKVCGAAGATHFTMTWIMLVFAFAGFAFPPLALLLVPIFMGLIAAGIVYKWEEKGGGGKVHAFVTQVLGAGGATFWLLGFLALCLSFASVVFPPLVFILVPAAAMILSYAFMHYYKQEVVVQDKTSVIGDASVAEYPTEFGNKKTDKKSTSATNFLSVFALLNCFSCGKEDNENDDQEEKKKLTSSSAPPSPTLYS